MSYHDDVKINKYQLEDLWEDHVDRFIKWSDAYADAVLERDDEKEMGDYERGKLKDQLELRKAELDNEYRNNWENYGLQKAPTERMVETFIIQHASYQEALDELREAIHVHNQRIAQSEHKLNLIKGAKEGFDHRRKALEGLTNLLVQGHFNAKLPKALKEEAEGEKREIVQDAIRKSLTRKREK